MIPTVGRMVYYKTYGTPGGEHPSEDRAAVITKVHNATCIDLCVFNPTGLFFNQSVTQGDNGGQWNWMPYQTGQAQKTEQLEKELNSKTRSEVIAKVCHEVNRAFCRTIADYSQPSWEDAPQWQKDSAINGVEFHLSHETTPEQSHVNWMKEKLIAGWVYGLIKDPDKKEHPCMVDYNQLPVDQRTKDHLFKAVVDSYK